MGTDKTIFILAGGFGTRLQSVVKEVPKPMALIAGKPFLDYQISEIRGYYPESTIYLLTHYLSDVIESYYQDDKQVAIIKESEPMGTGGSIKHAIKSLRLSPESALLVFNGDTYIKPDLHKFTASTANIGMIASLQENCDRYGTLEIENGHIVGFVEKKAGSRNSYINAGCYYFNGLDFFASLGDGKFHIEDKFKEHVSKQGMKAYKYDGVFIDIGIPEDYQRMIDYINARR